MPSYQKPPTVNEDARAQDIYRKAAGIINEKGFDATSMGDIADIVDLTKGGLYYYIKGKKALLYAIMDFALGLLERTVMAEAQAEKDPEKRLAMLLGGYVGLVLEEPDATAILTNEEERLDPSYRPRIVERKRAYADSLRNAIADLVAAQGHDSKVDPTVAAYSLLGMVHGVSAWYQTEGELGQEELIEQIQEMALRGLASKPPRKGPARKPRAASRRAVA